MNHGSMIWKHAFENMQHGNIFHHVDEIFKLGALEPIRKRLEFIYEINGLFEPKIDFKEDEFGFKTLEGAIQDLFEKGQNTLVTFTSQGKTFSMINHDGETIWLFDSHQSSFKYNFSTLAKFYNVESLSQYIRNKNKQSSFKFKLNNNNNVLNDLYNNNLFYMSFFKQKEK